MAVKKVEIRFLLRPPADTAQDIEGFPIETVEFIIYGRMTVFCFDKLFTQQAFWEVVLWFGGYQMEFYLLKAV